MLHDTPPPNEFARLLDSALRSEIDKVLGQEIEDAKARVEKAMRAAVGSIAAKVLTNFSYERMGQDLVIRVKFAFPETKPTP